MIDEKKANIGSLIFGIPLIVLGSLLYLCQGCDTPKQRERPETVYSCEGCLTVKDRTALEDDIFQLRLKVEAVEDKGEDLDREVAYNSKKIDVWKEHIVTWKEAVCQLTGKCLDPPKPQKCPTCPEVKCKPVYPGYEDYEE